MRVGWLHDRPPYTGGAELTMAEFKAAAPEDVEVVDCPAGKVADGLDRYVVGNCMTYEPGEIPDGAVRYHHDIFASPAEATYSLDIFCSPLQRGRMGAKGPCIPPAIDLDAFRRFRDANHRSGAVCLGRMSYGKGLEQLAEYEEPVDVYSSVPFESEGNARYKGIASDPARILASYERFVFLPTAIEPFGRAVAEAWAAGLVLVINRNVGAAHWIANAQEKLKTAGADFWEAVLS